jgi:hypothetical protein
MTPCRLVDTRAASGPLGGPGLKAGKTRTFVLTGVCGVPASAKALSVNLGADIPWGKSKMPWGGLTAPWGQSTMLRGKSTIPQGGLSLPRGRSSVASARRDLFSIALRKASSLVTPDFHDLHSRQCKPVTRLNSRRLAVTRVAPSRRA